MLAIISDLHLSDGTAGRHNVPATAFAGWYNEILSLALRNRAEEILFVYLGDIADFLRSERWFNSNQPVSRPWNDANINDHPLQTSEESLTITHEILDAIEIECNDSFAFLSGDLERLSPSFLSERDDIVQRIRDKIDRLDIPIHRLYLPGNHDRLTRIDPTLMSRMHVLLGSEPDPPIRLGMFPTVFQNPRYGVVARHGHEWDVWNFEDYHPQQEINRLSESSFLKTPIGDPIAVELAVRVPLELKKRLENDGAFSDAESDFIYRRMQNLDNVRPLAATIPWILMQGDQLSDHMETSTQQRLLIQMLDQTIVEVFSRFMELPFVRGWIEKHDRSSWTFDESDTLQTIDRFLRSRSFFNHLLGKEVVKHHRLAGILEWLEKNDAIDQYALYRLGASKEAFDRRPKKKTGIRYCVYGHTHHPEHLPLSVSGPNDENVYFNSGTWRSRVDYTLDKLSFIDTRVISYLTFYSDREDPLPGRPDAYKGPSYEAWSGLRLRKPRE